MPVPPSNTTIGDIIRRAKERADIEKSGSAGLCSPQELLDYANVCFGALHFRISTIYENYLAQYVNLQTVPSRLKYQLPADFYKLLGIGLVDIPGDIYNTWTPLQHWDFFNQNVPGTGFLFFSNGFYSQMCYRILGENAVEFRPVKSQSFVGIWYVPRPPKFTDLAQGLPLWVQPSWEEYPVSRMASFIATKEQRENTVHETLWKEIEQQIVGWAGNRDAFQPETVKRAWFPRTSNFYLFGGPGNGGVFG